MGLWEWISHTNPDAWAAIGNWITAAVAVAAATFALRQLREMRRAREEQAQPYVVAAMESDPHDASIVDLVVKNFGTTAARDVRIKITPAPKRASFADLPTPDVWLFDRLPFLAPGQEWRTFWDLSGDHLKSDLAQSHHVVVSYTDARGRRMNDTEAELDWAAFSGRRWMVRHGIHDIAKALMHFEKTTRTWNESYPGGLRVTIRSGDAKDAVFEAEKQAALAEVRSRRSGVVPDPKGGPLRRALRWAARIMLNSRPHT